MIVIKCDGEMIDVEGYIGYYVIIQYGKIRFLKTGTSERGTARFNDKDYQKYSSIKPLFIVKFDNANQIYNFEDISKSILRDLPGLNWVKNDRFTYFQLPEKLPFAEKYGEKNTFWISVK